MAQFPNLMLITSHDLGWHLGCYGINSVQSKHIDALAADGVRFSKSYCTAPQCSPSRASIYTGRYPHANGVMGLCHGLFGWDLNPDEKHLAQRLKDEGYTTGLIHTQHETRRPEQMGFDHLMLNCGEEVCVDRTVDFLNARQQSSQPFYLQIGFQRPHRKNFTESGFRSSAGDGSHVKVPPYLIDEPTACEDVSAFENDIHALDKDLGRIFSSLKETGLEENTLIVFAADHGAPFPRAKCTLYDPGLEAACIMRWPAGGLVGGRDMDALISNVDYLSSLLDLLGLPIPENVQGRSFAPWLRGENYTPRDHIFGEMTYHDYYDPRRCIRTCDHKLIINFSAAPFLMNPTQQWRPRSMAKHPDWPAFHPLYELYDLHADPLEQVNLADHAEHEGNCRQLLSRIYTWMKSTDDPLLKGPPISPQHQLALELLH